MILNSFVTATEIIAEIKALPPEGKEQVLRFVRSLDSAAPLSGKELASMAEELASSTDEVTRVELRSALVKGFYGGN